jgi:hypothetical protein
MSNHVPELRRVVTHDFESTVAKNYRNEAVGLRLIEDSLPILSRSISPAPDRKTSSLLKNPKIGMNRELGETSE